MLADRFNEPGDHFEAFVRLFLARWDKLNWHDKALTIFSQTKQEGVNSDIKVYNMTFQMAYQAVTEEVTPYVAIRTYIDGLKPKTRANLEQSSAILQATGRELDINETMAAAVQFEALNKVSNRNFISSGSRGNTTPAAHTTANQTSEQDLNTMQSTRDVSQVQCYNCQQYGHYQDTCHNPRVAQNPNSQAKGYRGRGCGRGYGRRGVHSGNALPRTN